MHMKQVKLICRHFSFSFIVLFASHALIANTTSTNFYQCETSKGVVFSQYPCSKEAKLKTISTFTPREIRDTSKDVKTLNKLQYQQHIDLVESKLSASQNKVRILKRTQAKKQIIEEQKLERMMSKQDKINTKRQVDKELKNINHKYNKLVKAEELKLSRLTKQLKTLKNNK